MRNVIEGLINRLKFKPAELVLITDCNWVKFSIFIKFIEHQKLLGIDMRALQQSDVVVSLQGWRAITCSKCKLRKATIPAGSLAIIEGIRRRHRFARAGELLLEQEQTNQRIMTIYSGLAIAEQIVASGERLLVDLLVPGDLVGVETLFGSARCSVQALTDLTVCEHDAHELHRSLSDPEVRDTVLQQMSGQLDRMTARLTSVAATGAKAALATFFLDAHARLSARPEAKTFRLPLSITQLGEALGLTAVHVHRLLRNFREEGLCCFENKIVTIFNFDRLVEVSGANLLPQSKHCAL
jgi:CRP-like cAMP-binding protein